MSESKINELYDPATNSDLASMLKDVGFEYSTGLKPVPFGAGDDGERGALLMEKENDLVLILHPGMGTSVLPHLRELRQITTYLGPVEDRDSIPADLLAHKFQDGYDDVRDPEKDLVNKYGVGSEFVSVAPSGLGRFHGYHNLDQDRPVALRIQKEFRENN